MILEFFNISKASSRLRSELQLELDKGYQSIRMAEMLDGEMRLENEAMKIPQLKKLLITPKNVMGVSIPKLEGGTREDHRQLADQLYSAYAQGKDARALAAIVGEGALSDLDRKFLDVANNFEQRFVNQGIDENRPIEQTLSIGWELLSDLSENELTRIKPEFIAKYAKADTQWWKKPHDRR